MGYYHPKEEGQWVQDVPRESIHGCDIRICLASYGIFYHDTLNTRSQPTIRSYSDGLKVGCSFITSEALEKLYRLHKEFLGHQDPKTHQKSAYAKD